jgi:hypothetical protein
VCAAKPFDQGLSGIVGSKAEVGLPHSVDGETARYLSSLVSSHSVSDNCQSASSPELLLAVRLGVTVVVLVFAPLTADV